MIPGKLVFLVLVVLLGTAVDASGQSLGELARKARAKKKQSSRKVWTNDDFRKPSLLKQEKEDKPKPQVPKIQVDDPWAELDKAREQLQQEQEDLAGYQEALRVRSEELRRTPTSDDMRRQALREAVAVMEDIIAGSEARVEELQARVAALEEQTKGRKRPQPVRSSEEPPVESTSPKPPSPSLAR